MKDAMRYILALDQGTTSSRAILFDLSGQVVAKAQQEITQFYPQLGWVEHDPEQIWHSQLQVAQQVIAMAGVEASAIAAIGITNQRETTIVWDRLTGKPIYKAIVWQDRRTSDECHALKNHADMVTSKTGLPIDAYFSATKIAWILDQVPHARECAQRGELCAGTVDSWLLWRLTGGAIHATDYSNASRTLLFNIHDLRWDEELLALFRVPASVLPTVLPTSHRYGQALSEWFGVSIPITSMVGDQQAALFGQGCHQPGMVKNTYGTGCFMLQNTGKTAVRNQQGMLTTIAWVMDGQVTYALEGSVFIAGAAIQWLRDELKLIDSAVDSAYFAMKVPDTAGVYVVPAFVGLGAPHWDMDAKGAVFGLTRGTSKAHLIRATLESLAYQTRDVLDTMMQCSDLPILRLRVDGGAAVNDHLMQFQADILPAVIDRPKIFETTALGAAYLAGLAVGVWTQTAIDGFWQLDQTFIPSMSDADRYTKYAGWRKAIACTRLWGKSLDNE